MSYDFYHLIHLISLVVVIGCLGLSYFSHPPKKWAKFLGMSASLILMIAGMGLLVKTIPGENWPFWIKAKMAIWMTIAISGPVMAKRLTSYRTIAFSFLMVLFVIAISLVVIKPSFS